MILVQNRLQRLSGNKSNLTLLGLLFVIVLMTSCDLFKPVQNGNNNGNGTEELGEIGSEKPPIKNPNVNEDGEIVGNNSNNNGDAGGDKNPDELVDTAIVTIDTPIDTAIVMNGYKGSYKVGILMPFYASDVSTAASMPPSAIQGMNFHEGALMALQQLSAEGVNLDIEIFDTRRSSAVVQALVDNYTLAGMDLIIGPVSSENVGIVANQVAKKGVPTVSLNLNSTLTSENPYFIQSSPYFDSHAFATIEYIKKRYPTAKIVIAVPSQGNESNRVAYYKNANIDLSKNGIPQSINEYYAETAGGSTYKFDGLADLLSFRDTTIVIAPVSSEGFAGGILRTLSLVRNTKPTIVFGMPRWMNFEKIDFSYMESCNVHVTNGSFVNDNNAMVRDFKSAFFTEYSMPPTVEAYKGYDLTLYFGRMLNKYGTGFINNLDEANANLLQTSFNFERVATMNADGSERINYLENKFVHILRLKNYKFIPVNRPEPVSTTIDD
jgi:hypothetical protein